MVEGWTDLGFVEFARRYRHHEYSTSCIEYSWQASIVQIRRTAHLAAIRRLLRDYPVVALLGARRVGKSTLARQVVAGWRGPRTVFDLEDDVDRQKLQDPGLALRSVTGLVVLDEVQHLPDLFRVLRVLADRPRHPARFLVLGSASPELLRQTSESLAGRIAFHHIDGFSLDELTGHTAFSLDRLWLRGGFPASYLARDEARSLEQHCRRSRLNARARHLDATKRFEPVNLGNVGVIE